MQTECKQIHLSFYKPEFDATLKTFLLPEKQHKFTALPNEIIKQAIEDKNRHPVVILLGHTPIGFFVLHKAEDWEQFTDQPNALLLRALSINHMYQGKGYALQAMSGLPKFVVNHFPEVDEIVLVVNEKNIAAQRLYEKSGFVDKGRRREGPIGRQKVYHYSLLIYKKKDEVL
ncbi:GNAT family N-acetyltransferase [Paenactinomyces guangxiensis]|uniref:GNAT family N-acetyltransferase n=1 Tax=Paenactinomyces guangxiensis TaxID=1490290 RepID=A0A7W1WQ13_9BACL|nr:GNAT family N-acetyltransferase [Paenactinomyces guangxiensis]MBA4493920.1 GNAT family N-acetyltransferase [Paenactinomyces guangxiensis]MBH8591386.1 GNAT family N-acetyltransferase [Paenactinomyces guangxiensis]